MLQYAIKRIFLGALTMFVIMFASYFMLRLAPGDPTRSNFLDGSSAGVSSSEKNELAKNQALRTKLKLDKPIITGFYEWLQDILLRGDFGTSGTVEPGKSVVKMIAERLPVTIKLNLMAITFAYILAIILGVYSAKYAESTFDRSSTFILFMLYSMPVMWVALLLQSTFCEGGRFPVFPLRGIYEVNVETGTFEAMFHEVYCMLMPALCLAYGSLAGLARCTRNNMLEILNSDFVRTARAKGLNEFTVIWKHCFANTLITLITLFSGLLPSLIAGSIIVEHIFNIPGMGSLSLLALSSRDYPLQMALFLFSGALTLISILIADIMYTIADPRIKLK